MIGKKQTYVARAPFLNQSGFRLRTRKKEDKEEDFGAIKGGNNRNPSFSQKNGNKEPMIAWLRRNIRQNV